VGAVGAAVGMALAAGALAAGAVAAGSAIAVNGRKR
jgi:hypothetical protein